MLSLIPVLLLLFIAIAIQLLGRFRLSIAGTWLFAAIGAVFVWGSMIIMRMVMPEGILFKNWNFLQTNDSTLIFKFSPDNWSLAFLLVSLLVFAIFSDSSRLSGENNLAAWTGAMVMTAFGLLAIIAQSIFAYVLMFTIIDIVEFGILTSLNRQKSTQYSTVIEFSIRIFGTLLIAFSTLFENELTTPSNTFGVSEKGFPLLLVGVVLRMGLLFFPIVKTPILPLRRNIGTLLQFIVPLSVFSFILKLPLITTRNDFYGYAITIIILVLLVEVVNWVSSKNELSGRNHWVNSILTLLLLSYLQGKSLSFLPLAMIMIGVGGALFVTATRSRFTTILSNIMMVTFMGFPFTPTQSLWVQTTASQNLIFSVFFGIIIIKAIRQNLFPSSLPDAEESWVKIFNGIGLILILLSPWIITLWNTSDFGVQRNWVYPAILSLILIMSIALRKVNLTKINEKPIPFVNLIAVLKRTWNHIVAALQFKWLARPFAIVYFWISKTIQSIIRLLEGDGGLLWSLLFLILIASFILKSRVR
jgi:hypothetical protein